MQGEEELIPEDEQQQQEQVAHLRRGLVRGWRGGGRGGGPRTPVPSWKLYENPFYEGLAAAVVAATEAAAKAAAGATTQGKKGGGGGAMVGGGRIRGATAGRAAAVVTIGGAAGGGSGGGASSSSVSARKLAASMWEELQDIPASARAPPPPAAFLLRRLAPPLLDPSDESPCSHLQSRPSSLSTWDSPHIDLSEPPNVPNKNLQPRAAFMANRPMKTIAILRPNASEESVPRGKSVSQSRTTHASPLGMDAAKQAVTLPDTCQLDESGLTPSPRDYVKSINRLRPEQQNGNSPVVSALRAELDLARARVQELEAAQRSARKDMEGFLKRCSDERMMLRNREQEKSRVAILSIGEELEVERKARKKLEVQNRKLLKNLSETNKRVVKAMQDLEDERKARQLMEDVCDELAREIGEDNAQVEKLKIEHAKAKEEIEEERRMLQMAEVWREERVQMKLSEARLELEENSMAVNNMRAEVEEFLSARRTLVGDDVEEQVEANQAEILQEALEKLQAQTAASMRTIEESTSPMCTIEESTSHPSGPDEACSSEETQLLHLPRDKLRPEPIQLLDPSMYRHVNTHDQVWNNHRYSARRNQAVLRSYSSRPQQLNKMGDRNVEMNNFRGNVGRVEVESEEDHSLWGCPSESRYDEEGEDSNWSADADDDDENGRDESWQCGSEDDEERSRSSLEFRRIMYSVSDTPVKMKGGLGAGSLQQNCGATRIVCMTDAPGVGESFTNSDVFYVEDSESAAGYSPTQQLPLNGTSSPVSRAPNSVWSLEVTAHHGPTRSSIEGSKDWPKPFRNNSLEAMLLEDRMNSPQFQPQHARVKPKRR